MLALGDSITRTPGSWAQRLAWALGLQAVILAEDGAHAPDVVAAQLPRAGGAHALATVYVGANDARSPTWDADRYRADLAVILAAAAERAPVVLALTIPSDLGRPPAGAKAPQAAAIVRAQAGRTGALVVELAGFGSRRTVWPDRVHPTPAGHAAIARRAAAVLAAAGPPAPGRVAQVEPAPDPDWRFAAAWGHALVRDLGRRGRERRQARGS
jgi:lysophospholipase L1-like esterase